MSTCSQVYANAVPMELVREGKPSEIRIFAALSSFQGKDGVCWPSREKIAERAGVHMSHVSEHVRSLQEKGWVKVDRKGKRRTNRYEVWRPDHNGNRTSEVDSPSTAEAEPVQSSGETPGDRPGNDRTTRREPWSGSANAPENGQAKVDQGDVSELEQADHAKLEPSNGKRNRGKEAEEKAPPAAVNEDESEEQIDSEGFEQFYKQLHIPPVMRPQHTRYKDILRSNDFPSRWGLQETQRILLKFARDARKSDTFNPADGPGLFMWKFRQGHFDTDPRDFRKEDRKRELQQFEQRLKEFYAGVGQKDEIGNVETPEIQEPAVAIYNLTRKTEADRTSEEKDQFFWMKAENFLKGLEDTDKTRIIEQFAASKGIDDLAGEIERQWREDSPSNSKGKAEYETVAV